ncbi:MAG: hypothetical protein JSW00_03935 [Thermoplasmata archaeon]|nr:MAG: hypothetical protein JSW00_03935 [Thermoplasmata archaeon]
MKKTQKITIAILILIIIAVSGCTAPVIKKNIYYRACYRTVFDLAKIESILTNNNITIQCENENIFFNWEEGINDYSVEATEGVIYKYGGSRDDESGEYSELILSLDAVAYPGVDKDDNYKEKLDQRKSMLEDSMEYLTSLINNSTGDWPESKEFEYGDVKEGGFW